MLILCIANFRCLGIWVKEHELPSAMDICDGFSYGPFRLVAICCENLAGQCVTKK